MAEIYTLGLIALILEIFVWGLVEICREQEQLGRHFTIDDLKFIKSP